MVVGGVPVGEVPPDRGQVADERVGDHPAGIREDGKPPPDQVGGLELRLADERPDDERAVPLGDRPEPGDPVEVDHVARGREPELHQGDEALTAREDLRVAAEPAEQRDGVLEGGRAVILEGRRNHARPPSAGNQWTGGEADCRPILGAAPGPVKGRLGRPPSRLPAFPPVSARPRGHGRAPEILGLAGNVRRWAARPPPGA